MSSSTVPSLGDEEVRLLADAISVFPKPTRQRGRAYALDGRVRRIARHGPLIEAEVLGTQRYETCWEWDERLGWSSDCSCPVAFDCKHAYAVGWIATQAAQPPARDGRERRARREPVDAAPSRRVEEEAQEQLAFALADWASRRDVAASRSLRLVLRPAKDRGWGPLELEARLTSPRVQDEPRSFSQLQQLRSEARRRANLLEPEQLQLLDFLVDHGIGDTSPYFGSRLSVRTLRRLLQRFGGGPLVSWAADVAQELAVALGTEPGAPVRLDPEPVRLVPVFAASEGAPSLELGFVFSEGRQLPLDGTFVVADLEPGAGSLVLVEGRFFVVVEQPPPYLVDEFCNTGPIRLGGRTRERLLQLLARSFPHLQGALATHTRTLPVMPILLLDLRDDRWLQVQLVAHTGPRDWRPPAPWPLDAKRFEYHPDAGWMRMEEPGAPAEGGDPDVWVEVPAPEEVESAVAWLERLRAHAVTKQGPGGLEPEHDDRAQGWWLHASAAGMEAFAQAWDAKPAELAAYGTPPVRRLLDPSVRVAPRVRVEASGVDWFAVSAEWEAEGLALSDADLAALRKSTGRFVRLRSGWVRRDVGDAQETALRTLANVGVEADGSAHRLSLWQLASAPAESLAELERLGADTGTLAVIRGLRESVARFAGLPRVEPPAALRGELRPYQRTGLDFLVHLSSLGLGAVLADDMGLGKTVQALAWLAHMRALDPNGGPALVVCPTSVVHNWQREAARFVPGLRVLVLERGPERHALRARLAERDLVITSYALLRRDAARWKEVPLRAAILDEAQNIKNPDADVTRAALGLRARHRLALTGTPLENRPLDLWSLMAFVNPGYLGTRAAFVASYDRVDAPPHARALLAAKLRPVLLRRMKREVAPELPDRIEERRDCELRPAQRKLYLAELTRSRALVEGAGRAPADDARQKIAILAALTRLRQICCHPALAGGSLRLGSGKFDALFEVLEPLLAEGHKVLVFSQFVECLELVRHELEQRAIAHHVLTGKTPKRARVVAEFSDDPRPCVFLISLKAGGTGLNLIAASYVILLDPWWNPAVEAQAIDRTHRIGQDRTVIAYRLVATGTIEEKILELQARKAALVRDVLGEGGLARALTRDDLEYLFAE